MDLTEWIYHKFSWNWSNENTDSPTINWNGKLDILNSFGLNPVQYCWIIISFPSSSLLFFPVCVWICESTALGQFWTVNWIDRFSITTTWRRRIGGRWIPSGRSMSKQIINIQIDGWVRNRTTVAWIWSRCFPIMIKGSILWSYIDFLIWLFDFFLQLIMWTSRLWFENSFKSFVLQWMQTKLITLLIKLVTTLLC